MYFSNECDKIGVTDIGLKSGGLTGLEVLGMGAITADFHCRGTMPSANDCLNNSASGAARIGAAMRRNHTGNPSIPAAVGLRLGKGSGRRNMDGGLQVQLEEDGGSGSRQSWMESRVCGLRSTGSDRDNKS